MKNLNLETPRTILPADRFWSVDRSFEATMKNLPTAAGMTEQLPPVAGRSMVTYGDIGIIEVLGPLEKGRSMFGALFGSTSMADLRYAVRDAAADSSIKTIVLRIDSPGGSVDGLAELGDAIYAARDSKRIIAQVDGTAASAAYYIASQAHVIHSGRMDLVGSIGTRLVLVDASAALEAQGVSVISVDTGDLKSSGLEGLPIRDQDIDYFQGLVDSYFADFKAAVTRGRGDRLPDFGTVSTGAIFPARVAKSLGLIDRISSIDSTIETLRSRRQNKSRLNSHMLACA